MSTNVLSNVGLILNVCESSPKNTKVTWAKTGALPWQIHRLPGRSSEMSRNRLNGGNARCSPSSKPHPPSLSFLLIIVVVVVVVVAPPPVPRSISTPPGEGANNLLLVVAVVPCASSPSRSVPAPLRSTRVLGTIVRASPPPLDVLVDGFVGVAPPTLTSFPKSSHRHRSPPLFELHSSPPLFPSIAYHVLPPLVVGCCVFFAPVSSSNCHRRFHMPSHLPGEL